MSSEPMENMMPEMTEKMFGDMSTDDKKEMMTGMMGKMCEGVDMKEMMPMMDRMKQGGMEQSMPEMMLATMMPHCIGMMLPGIDPDKRGEAAATIIAAIVDKGTAGLSDEQKKSFLETIKRAIEAS